MPQFSQLKCATRATRWQDKEVTEIRYYFVEEPTSLWVGHRHQDVFVYGFEVPSRSRECSACPCARDERVDFAIRLAPDLGPGTGEVGIEVASVLFEDCKLVSDQDESVKRMSLTSLTSNWSAKNPLGLDKNSSSVSRLLDSKSTWFAAVETSIVCDGDSRPRYECAPQGASNLSVSPKWLALCLARFCVAS